MSDEKRLNKVSLKAKTLRDFNGCHLHIATEDGNLDDSDIEFCLKDAILDECDLCVETASSLLLMGIENRARVYLQRDGIPASKEEAQEYIQECYSEEEIKRLREDQVE